MVSWQTFWHMDTFECTIVQCLTCILPITRLDYTHAFSGTCTSFLTALVPIVVTVLQFQEGLGKNLTEKQQASVVAQVGVTVVG